MCTEPVLPHLGQAARVDDGRVPDLPHEVGEVGRQQHHVGTLLQQRELLQPLEVVVAFGWLLRNATCPDLSFSMIPSPTTTTKESSLKCKKLSVIRFYI